MENINVVIAEDDFRIAQIHEEYLKHIDGVTLIGKTLTAQDTLKKIEEHKVDLLLLDIYMPDQLGIDLIVELRQKFKNLDIILITAARDKYYLDKALKYGVIHYLVKPVTLGLFVETINQYIFNKRFLDSITDVEQNALNILFKQSSDINVKSDLPAGIDYLTLEKVQSILSCSLSGLTADKVAIQMGASRTTARRYLEYLVSINKAFVEQEYGSVGRPERNYYSFTNTPKRNIKAKKQ